MNTVGHVVNVVVIMIGFIGLHVGQRLCFGDDRGSWRIDLLLCVGFRVLYLITEGG